MLLTACWWQRRQKSGDSGAEQTAAVQRLHRRAREPARPGQHHRVRGQPGHRRAVDRPRPVRRRTARSQYTGVADSIKSDDNTTWTIKLKDGWTFHDGTPVDAAVVRRRVELHRAEHQRPGRLLLLRQRRGLRPAAGRDRRRRQRHQPAGGEGDVGPQGRRRQDLHRHPHLAVRPVPGDRRLHGVLPAAQGVLRRPRRLRQEADRQRPVQGRRGLRPGSGHHAHPQRGLPG